MLIGAISVIVQPDSYSRAVNHEYLVIEFYSNLLPHDFRHVPLDFDDRVNDYPPFSNDMPLESKPVSALIIQYHSNNSMTENLDTLKSCKMF